MIPQYEKFYDFKNLELSLNKRVALPKITPPKPIMESNKLSSMKVRFDQLKNAEQDGYDYSPLPRITWHSSLMGVLVSMGGLM